MEPGDHLSHYKALCLATRMNRHESSAKPLADHLAKINGHFAAYADHVLQTSSQ